MKVTLYITGQYLDELSGVFFFFSSFLLQNLQGLTGTPLVAGSPIRHDNTVQGNTVEVQTYQAPWKTLSDFALQSDLDQPAFQQLVGSHEISYIKNKL